MDTNAANRWAMILHLSLLAGHIIPLAGFIAPLVIWQIKKDEFPVIDTHGRIAMNWIISEMIYFVLAIMLFFLLIGIPLMYFLIVLGVAFPIIAAVKANNGEIWRYPGSITFFAYPELESKN